jgi:hypothetical protein
VLGVLKALAASSLRYIQYGRYRNVCSSAVLLRKRSVGGRLRRHGPLGGLEALAASRLSGWLGAPDWAQGKRSPLSEIRPPDNGPSGRYLITA